MMVKVLDQQFETLSVERGERKSSSTLAVQANAANASKPKAGSTKPKIVQSCNTDTGQADGLEKDRNFGNALVCGSCEHIRHMAKHAFIVSRAVANILGTATRLT